MKGFVTTQLLFFAQVQRLHHEVWWYYLPQRLAHDTQASQKHCPIVLTSIYNRLLLQGKGCSFHEGRHKAKFHIVLLQEVVPVPGSHFLDVTEKATRRTFTTRKRKVLASCIYLSTRSAAHSWLELLCGSTLISKVACNLLIFFLKKKCYQSFNKEFHCSIDWLISEKYIRSIFSPSTKFTTAITLQPLLMLPSGCHQSKLLHTMLKCIWLFKVSPCDDELSGTLKFL